MNQAINLAAIAPNITQEGRQIPFGEFLSDQAPNDELYEGYISDILKVAQDPNVEWVEVIDYVAPIAREVLSEAVQTDVNIYLELVQAISSAREKLIRLAAAEQGELRNDREYVLDRGKPEFFGQIDGLLHEFARGRVVKEFDNQPLGCYRVVVGEPSNESDR